MLNKEKALGILALNRMIEQGYIIPEVNQIFTLYWVSYKLVLEMEDIDYIIEAEKLIEESIRNSQ